MLWSKKLAAADPGLEEAQAARAAAERHIEVIDSQDSEVFEVVGRLDHRARRNNFGESLTRAYKLKGLPDLGI